MDKPRDYTINVGFSLVFGVGQNQMFKVFLLALVAFSQLMLLPGNSTEVAQSNAQLLTSAIQATRDTVTIPPGDWFVQGPLSFDSISNRKISLMGNLTFLPNIDTYPFENGFYPDLFSFNNSHYITMEGPGALDGSGFEWWKESLMGFAGQSLLKRDERPKLLTFRLSTNLVINDLVMVNSPFWHLNLDDVANVTINNLVVDVDTERQHSALPSNLISYPKRPFSLYRWGLDQLLSNIPLFPLNTDGIDPAGINITIRNFTYRGYDDAIAVKPQSLRSIYSRCTSDLLLDGANVTFSTGMAIGSVSTRPWRNCIDKVTIRNVEMVNPLKGIYVKSNPKSDKPGSGQISNILFENFKVTGSIWWPIYIGPQQQYQPDASGPGCMNYPLEDCETNSEMEMTNITLRNIAMTRTIFPYAGLIRANASSPIIGLVLDRVNVEGNLASIFGFISEFAMGITRDVSPSI